MIRNKSFPKHPIMGLNEINAVTEVIASGQLSGYRANLEYQLGGKKVRQFEEAFADYFGVKYAIAMNSATACLHSALIACGIGKGDEVIVSPYTFSASASCVLMVGATPVFIDIQDDIFCIDPTKIKGALTKRTKAIIPVHLCGHPANMMMIMAMAKYHNLVVIEDAAQAIGATHFKEYVGTIGDCGVFSFNQSKTICTGEGGMLITNDNEIAEKVRLIRNHGEVYSDTLGYNYRMTELTAAVGVEQFKRLEWLNKQRIELANYLTEELNKIEGLTPPVVYPFSKHVFYTYATKFNEDIIGMSRDEFQDRMIAEGIYFGRGYVKPLYRLPVFGGKKGLCPVAERMWRKLMVTDIVRPPATIADMKDIVKAVKKILYGII